MSEVEALKPEFEDIFAGKKIDDIARMYIDAKDKLGDLKAQCTEAQKWYDKIRHHGIPDKMEEMGATSIKLKGIGRVTVTGDMYAGIQKGLQPEAHQWLIENGHEDLIKDYIHPSTMKAFIKEQFEEQGKEGFNGNPLPEDVFRIDPFMRGSVTK